MAARYSNNFLNQYSVANAPVARNTAIGAGLGGVAGGGVGALFASLASANPALGLLGAVPGAVAGGAIGMGATRRNAYKNRLAAYNNLSPAEQHNVVRAFVNDMNSSVYETGVDGGFEDWYARNPEQFEQFMLKNM